MVSYAAARSSHNPQHVVPTPYRSTGQAPVGTQVKPKVLKHQNKENKKALKE
jgi:hypothetical protein